MRAYIKKGPAVIGNRFGYYGVTVPEDRWVIVEDGEYTNGGYGPSSVDGKLYKSEEAARQALEKLIQEEQLQE